MLSGSIHLCIERRRHDIFGLVAIEEVIKLLEQEYGSRKWLENGMRTETLSMCS